MATTARPALTRREAIARARRSRKFRDWKGVPVIFKSTKSPDTPHAEGESVSTERHFNPKEVATMWGLSIATIRRLFEKEPGVLKIANATGATGKRSYKTLRIPASIAVRVHRRISA